MLSELLRSSENEGNSVMNVRWRKLNKSIFKEEYELMCKEYSILQ